MWSWFRRKSQELPAAPSAVHGALEMYKPWARPSLHPQPNTLAGISRQNFNPPIKNL